MVSSRPSDTDVYRLELGVHELLDVAEVVVLHPGEEMLRCPLASLLE